MPMPMPQQPMPGAPPPGGLPPGQPAPMGASPASGPPGAGGPKPPQGGGQNIILLLLSFLAGAGMGDVVKNLQKVMQPQGAGAARKHQGGVRMDAAKAPGMTIAPQMLQQMQQKQAGGPAQDPKLMMLIQQLLSPSA